MINNKGKNTINNKLFLAKRRKMVRIIVVVLGVAVAAFILSMPCAQKIGKTSEEYTTANKILRKKVKGKLKKDWFVTTRMNGFMPQEVIYVDLDTHAVVIGEKAIYYEPDNDNRNIIRAKDEKNDKELDRIIKKKFKIDTANKDLRNIAATMGALQEYVEPVLEAKNINQNNRILSMIYNTIIGDSLGHVIVSLNNSKMSIVRSNDLNIGAIDVKQFYATMTNITEGTACTRNRNLLQILIQEGVLDTNITLNVPYYDLRHDCIRMNGDIICKYSEDSAQFQRIAKKMKANPLTIYSYNEEADSLVVINDSYLCNGKKMYGKVDIKALESVGIKDSHPNVINGIMLVIGLIIGLVSYPLLRKKAKRTMQLEVNAENECDSSTSNATEVLTANDIIAQYKSSDEYKTIKEQADNYPKLLDLAKKIKESESKLKESANKYEMLRNCKNESDLLELMAKYGIKKINTFQQLKEREIGLSDVVKLYDNQTKHNLSKALHEIEEKAKWYDDNKEIAVNSIDRFRQSIIGKRCDRTSLYKCAMLDLAIPILGDAYNEQIKSIINEAEQIELESKAYRQLLDTQKTFSPEGLMNKLMDLIGEENAKWIVSMREGARRYKETKNFSDTMWTRYIKEFIEKEPKLKDSSSLEDKGWYFGMLMNIAYHTVDYIRIIKESGDAILCYNQNLMKAGFDLSVAKDFAVGNINKSTEHTNTIYKWATEAGVNHLEIVVENFAILK